MQSFNSFYFDKFSFNFQMTLVMVWRAFLGFDKCPLVLMPPNKQTSIDFVDVIYNLDCFSEFYYMHDDSNSLLFMEDGTSMQRRTTTTHWRQVHGIKILIWFANSLDLNPIENMLKIVKDHIQN